MAGAQLRACPHKARLARGPPAEGCTWLAAEGRTGPAGRRGPGHSGWPESVPGRDRD